MAEKQHKPTTTVSHRNLEQHGAWKSGKSYSSSCIADRNVTLIATHIGFQSYSTQKNRLQLLSISGDTRSDMKTRKTRIRPEIDTARIVQLIET
jgi:hypothetical protein